MKIEPSFEQGVLTLVFIGQLDSGNAPAVEAEVSKALRAKGIESVTLDFAKLDYITSAGLRIILGIWKKYKNTQIVNANINVYEIFKMTGFTEMMTVHRARREISVEGLPVIGEGFTAIVYRLTPDSIVKVFKSERSMEAAQLEIEAAKKAFIYGIPTAISFDIVNVGDKIGLVFELLDCASLRDLILEHPEKFEEYKKIYADLSYKITHTVAKDSGLPNCKGPLLEKFQLLQDVLSKEEYGKLIGMIEALPDTGTLIHGDYHIKNVLVQNGEPLLIDMDAVSLGHPIFELENIYLSFKAYCVAEPDNASSFFGVSQRVLDDLYEALFQRYFPNKTPEEMKVIHEKVLLLGTTHLAYQTIRYHRDVNGRLKKALSTIRELLKKYDDLDILK